MIKYGDINSNVYTYDIITLLVDWGAEDCMDTPSMFHTREYFVLKYQGHDTDTPTYMEALSGENA